MKIKKLEMKNWRGYFGTQTIEFSTDPEKPVTVLIGDNKTGKSDILRAIHWVLYDEVPEHTSKRNDLINNHAEMLDPSSAAQVTLEIINDAGTFKLTRVLDVDLDKSDAGSRFFAWELNSSNVFDDVKFTRGATKWINSNFLPNHLKHIFLFQGEVLADTFDNENEEELNEAIRNVTGTNYIAYAKELLNEYKELKEIELEKKSLKLQGQTEAANDIQSLKDELDKIDKKIDEKKEQEKELIKKKNSLNTKLVGAKDKNAAEASAKIAEAERTRNKYQKKEQEVRKELHKLIGEYGYSIFASNSMNDLNGVDPDEPEANFLTEIESPQREEALEDLISDKKCICGRDLIKGQNDEEIAKIQKEIALATSNDQRTRLRNIDLAITVSQSKIESFNRVRKGIQDRMKEAKKEISDANEIIEQNKKILSESELTVDERTAKELIDEIDKEKLPPIQSSLRLEELKRDEQAKKLQKARQKTKTLMTNSDITDLEELINIATELFNMLDKYTKDDEETVKERLKASMEDKVRKHGTGDELLVFDENSMLPKLISPSTREENPQSEGGNNMKSICFGTSLVEVSLNRTDAPDWIESGISFPFICDAPFSVLGSVNERSASEMITSLDSQIVYLVNPKAYISGIRDVLSEMGKEGKRYFIEAKRTGKLNKPSQAIDIGGSKYTDFKGNCAKEGSEIREVEVD